MLDFLAATNNLPFSIALAIALMMVLLEAIGFVFGLSGLDLLDAIAPEHDAAGAELAGSSLVDRFMGWLQFGRVPVIILLVIFLASFGVIGLALQALAVRGFGAPLPGLLLAAGVVPLSLPPVRVLGRLLARVLPRDETSVVSRDALVGRMATVVIGEARRGSPAQARVKDQHGQTHYLMLEPDSDADTFRSGETVLLVARAGAVYQAIRSTNPSLKS
jgi:hypothetical protein